MTNETKPATDEEITTLLGLNDTFLVGKYGQSSGIMASNLLARIASDAEKLRAKDEEIERLKRDNALLPSAIEAAALSDWMRQALMGEEVSDFGQSFAPVRLAMEARAEIERLRKIEAAANSDDGCMGDGYKLARDHAKCPYELSALRSQVKVLREALASMTDAAITDSDACSICLHGTPQHSSGCSKVSALAALASTEEPKG